MTALVLDCSIAAAWLFADEAGPETDHLLARIKDGGALVPNLWHLEVGNMLLQAEKRVALPRLRLTSVLRCWPTYRSQPTPKQRPAPFRKF